MSLSVGCGVPHQIGCNVYGVKLSSIALCYNQSIKVDIFKHLIHTIESIVPSNLSVGLFEFRPSKEEDSNSGIYEKKQGKAAI